MVGIVTSFCSSFSHRSAIHSLILSYHNLNPHNRHFVLSTGADDQQSLNIVVNDMLIYIYAAKPKPIITSADIKSFPMRIEKAISPDPPGWKTALWSAFQLQNSAAGADILPVNIGRIRKEGMHMISDKVIRLMDILVDQYIVLTQPINTPHQHVLQCRTQEVSRGIR